MDLLEERWTAPQARALLSERVVSASGLRVRIFEACPRAKSGTVPLVLLHGVGGCAEEWAACMTYLAEHVHVIAPDLPGHGASDKPAAAYDLEYYLAFLDGLFSTLELPTIDLAGWSAGGALALAYALARPGCVRRLALIASAGLGQEVSWRYRLLAVPFVTRNPRPLPPALFRMLERGLYYGARCPDQALLLRKYAHMCRPGAVAAFVATVRWGVSLHGQRVTLLPRLKELAVPLLIIWGRQDPILPLRHALAAHHAVPGSRLVVLEQCGHMCPLEYPREVAGELLRHVQMSEGASTRTPTGMTHADSTHRHRARLPGSE
jgi:pimeloyl-ACP methyl ester carboxylesterase